MTTISSTFTAASHFSRSLFKAQQIKKFSTGPFQGKTVTFPASARVIARYPGYFAAETIKQEVDLFASDMDFSLKNSGPINSFFLKKMLEIPYVQAVYRGKHPGMQIIVDTRTHHLKSGEQPAIPGWHTDFVERSQKTEMQPDYSRINPAVKTYVVNYSDQKNGVSNTEYLENNITLNLPKYRIYQSLDQQIKVLPYLDIGKLEDGSILEMDQLSLHRGTEAFQNGWRGFIRLAVLHDLTTTILQTNPQNERRSHLQSYRGMDAEIQSRNKQQKHLLKNEYSFHPKIETVPFTGISEILKVYSTQEIKQEPMIINGSLEFCSRYGGPITIKFLEAMKKHPLIQNIIQNGREAEIKINTRVHMLMKGQSPDLMLFRSGAPFQEMIHPTPSIKHFILLLSNQSTGVSNMEFCTISHKYKSTGSPTLNAIQRSIDAAKCPKVTITDQSLISFEQGTLHRALPAHNSGWRLALVLSIDSRFIQNEIIKQIPVYLEDITLGW